MAPSTFQIVTMSITNLAPPHASADIPVCNIILSSYSITTYCQTLLSNFIVKLYCHSCFSFSISILLFKLREKLSNGFFWLVPMFQNHFLNPNFPFFILGGSLFIYMKVWFKPSILEHLEHLEHYLFLSFSLFYLYFIII
jgi:phosphoribulokinase